MNSPIQDLCALEAMTPAQLRSLWRDTFRKPVPDLGPDLMRRSIAWHMQSRTNGKLPMSTRRSIDKAIKQLETIGELAEAKAISLKPGTKLVREWGGNSHHVLVCDSGFEYDNRQYDSLSQIARDITGAQWSGPRFFGLKAGHTFASKVATGG